jgi:hypothetical protein
MGQIDMRPTKEVISDEEILDEEELAAPADSSPAEPELDEEDEAEEAAPVEPVKDPATVEQERVAALAAEADRIRRDIVELRRDRRMARHSQPIIVPDTDLDDVAPTDVALIERVLQAKGYVRKDDLASQSYQERMDSAKDSWLVQHPEYLPENDPEDLRWNKLNSTLSSYFKAPPKPEDVAKLMDLAHGMVGGKVRTLPTKTPASTAAAQEKLSVQSRGQGGSAGQPAARPNKNIDTQYLIGFDDDELQDIASG